MASVKDHPKIHSDDKILPTQTSMETEDSVQRDQDQTDSLEPDVDLKQDVEKLERMPSGPAYSIFTKHQKGYIVFMVAAGGFFSPMSASIYFPVLNVLAKDLHVSNSLINLTLTSYMIFQGLAPTILGDIGDMTGRRPAYVIGFVIYIGANIGLAVQNNYAALMVLRCMQSMGSSGTIALGNGVVGDIASSGERGKYMGTSSQTHIKKHDMLTMSRTRAIWNNGCPCHCSCDWRPHLTIPGLEVAFLVPYYSGRRLPCPFPHNLP